MVFSICHIASFISTFDTYCARFLYCTILCTMNDQHGECSSIIRSRKHKLLLPMQNQLPYGSNGAQRERWRENRKRFCAGVCNIQHEHVRIEPERETHGHVHILHIHTQLSNPNTFYIFIFVTFFFCIQHFVLCVCFYFFFSIRAAKCRRKENRCICWNTHTHHCSTEYIDNLLHIIYSWKPFSKRNPEQQKVATGCSWFISVHRYGFMHHILGIH